MKIIIVGCGRLGSGIAKRLEAREDEVVVIDVAPDAFKLLGKTFTGKKITGLGFDRDVLEEAGVQSADAVIASSNSDDVNALIGRVARNIYKVPYVISRLYDPRCAELYQTLGIETISTTAWGIERIIDKLNFTQLDNVFALEDGDVQIVRVEIPTMLTGRAVKELVAIGEVKVIAIHRDNKTFLPTLGTTFEQHDVIYISVLTASVEKLKAMLGLS